MIRLQLQISHFPDCGGFNGLLAHVGDDEFRCELLRMLWDDREPDYHGYVPFSG